MGNGAADNGNSNIIMAKAGQVDNNNPKVRLGKWPYGGIPRKREKESNKGGFVRQRRRRQAMGPGARLTVGRARGTPPGHQLDLQRCGIPP